MISADIETDVKQEVKELIAVSYNFFTEVPSQKLKYNVKQAYIFPLILVRISSSLILPLRTGGNEGAFP